LTGGTVRCPGCAALVRAMPGVPHGYIGAAAGCWEVYESVLAKEYGEYRYPQPTHRLTVDAYAVQHPGEPSEHAIRSVSAHLVGLYLVLDRGVGGRAATAALRAVVAHPERFAWLEPPRPNGRVTVVEVAAARDQAEHAAAVERWARDVWGAWAAHHAAIRALAAPALR
jgi:Family of unknown function (DUF5946)